MIFCPADARASERLKALGAMRSSNGSPSEALFQIAA
jgi:hypothetical protein